MRASGNRTWPSSYGSSCSRAQRAISSGSTVRPAVAVLLPAIAFVEESLIVALQLVVEDDALNPTALAAETFLGALIGAIDLGVVRQLARLSDAGVEGLAGFVGAVVTLVPVGLEQVTAAIRQRHGAII